MSDINLRELERQTISDPSLRAKLFRAQIAHKAKNPLKIKLNLSHSLMSEVNGVKQLTSMAIMWKQQNSYSIMAKNTSGQELKFFNMTQRIIMTEVDLNDLTIPHYNGKATLIIAAIGTIFAQYTQSYHEVDLFDNNIYLEVNVIPALERNYQI